MSDLRKAVFLDRDGVINKAIVINGKPYPPKSLATLEILPGVKEALFKLKSAGYYLCVVTNQPDVARGQAALEDIQEIHEYMENQLGVDQICVCPHDDKDCCNCRKPRPGMILSVAADKSIDLAGSYMIGDRWRDIEAGLAAGCKTIFIDYGYDEKRPNLFTHKASSLNEASQIIIGGSYES
jgi:D-glycero-D-manno-heptose 1,7-bisphosphate phosphatase